MWHGLESRRKEVTFSAFGMTEVAHLTELETTIALIGENSTYWDPARLDWVIQKSVDKNSQLPESYLGLMISDNPELSLTTGPLRHFALRNSMSGQSRRETL